MKKYSTLALLLLLAIARVGIAQDHTQQVTAIQYYFNTDPGAGSAGNGGIIPVIPDDTVSQAFSFSLPALSDGINHLYIRAKDEFGKWSIAERRSFYISDNIILEDLIAIEYYFDNDPGVGNGTVQAIGPTSSYSGSLAITLPGGLTPGIHHLYIRTKDSGGSWSISERRSFYITDNIISNDITALEYYIDNDPGVGNGTVQAIGPTSSYSGSLAITLPGGLTSGIHHLYIRTKDSGGSWSISERRSFYISDDIISNDITALEYYIDNDPGVGNGTIQAIGPTSSYLGSLVITLPGGLTSGIHHLYIRTKDSGGSWSVSERRSFYIHSVPDEMVLTAFEYYYDSDPGPGNANPVDIADGPSFSGIVELGVPCLSAGTHYLYLRARDQSGSWSIIGRDTLVVTGGIEATVISPAGPLTFCPTGSVTLAFDSIPGMNYQWQKDAIDISGATSSTLIITEAGNYQVKAYCGAVFSISNVVVANVLPLLTFYADADNDSYGNILIDSLDCSQPSGYVANSDDCDDTDVDINPAETEICNEIDDNCNGQIDEGVQNTYYADIDMDGFGDPGITVLACSPPAGYVNNNADCDDNDDDVNPAVTEICNLIDDDCDGLIDEGVQITYYADSDQDTYGDPGSVILACSQPAGYVSNDDDCDDTDEDINPGAVEACNGIDDNCEGNIDEGFVYSVAGASISSTLGESFCVGGTTMLSVNGGILGTGAEWVWYENGCGDGAPLATGLSIPMSPTAGVHVYYVRAEGICNNSACVSMTVTVNEAPVFQVCPTDITTGNDASLCNAAVSYSVLVSGTPAPVLTYTFTGATTGSGSGNGSGSTFEKGTTLVTVTAINTCGAESCSFNITVNDTENPLITGCPSPVTTEVEEGQWGAHVSWTIPAATDNCVLNSLTSTHNPGDFFNVGSTVVTYTASDEAGNESTCDFFITVTPPDILGTVNVSVTSANISFSENNPDPGTTLTVIARIRNNSNIDAGSFSVRFTEMYTNTVYPLITVSGLNAGQSALVNQFITAPNVAAYVPVQVDLDVMDDLDESAESDNAAIRPFICGSPATAGTVDVMANASPASVPAGSNIQICGSASYDPSPPLADPSVAGAEIVITIEETGEQFSGYTDEDGNFCITYATPNTPGEYHFTVEINDNTLSGNSSGTFNLTAPVFTCPTDLSVSIELTGITPSISGSYIVPVGTTFSGTVYVQNNCEAISQATSLYVGITSGSPVPYEVPVPSLGPGEVYPVILPSIMLATQGTYYLSATVDYNDIIVESDEYNNTAFKILIVLPPLPDIVAEGGSVLSQLQCFPGNQANFSLSNKGLAPTGAFTSVFNLYINNVLDFTDSEEVTNLDPGEYASLSFPFTATSSTDIYRFELIADFPDDVEELSEFNNYYSFQQIFKECFADLVLLGCGFADVKPVDPMDAGSATITATIRNVGDLAVNSPFVVTINVAGITVDETVTGPLAAQQSLTLTVNATVPETECGTLIVIADPDNDITEEDDGNNDYTASLCYDFDLVNLNCAGLPVFNSTQYYCIPADFSIAYWNTGLYEASDFRVKFEISGPGLPGWVYLGTETTYAGNSCGCPFYIGFSDNFYYPQTGVYQVRMTADPGHLYIESDETNNEIILSVNVVDAADYEVLSPYIFPSDVNPDINEIVTFSVSYTNTGCDGFNPIELYTQVDDVPLYSQVVPPLPNSGWFNAAIPAPWSSSVPGVHVFRAIIDNDEIIAEADEINNEATKAIIVGELPDYNVLSIAVSDDSPQIGENITISTSVLNEGQTSGSGVLLFIITDSQGNETIINEVPVSINSGNTDSYYFDWITSDPHARVIARIVNVIPGESDLTDNEKETRLNELLVSLSGSDVLCYGEISGEITVTITGGESPFNFEWSDPSLYGEAVNVYAGDYSVIVTDINGFSASANITISEPDALVASASFTPILCNGETSTVTVSATGGTLPYTGTGDFDVSAGPHSFTVTDGNGCTTAVTIAITEPDALVVLASFTPILCNGETSTVTISATGGTLPYTGTGDFNVVAGPHSFTVTDGNGCTTAVTVAITEPDALVALASFTPILCNGETSTVTISATGGTLPYAGIGDFNLVAGPHSFTVTDGNGCTSLVTVTITEPDALTAMASYTPIPCQGGSSEVIITATGGTLPYSGTGTFNVSEGTHIFTVTDGNGCTATCTQTVIGIDNEAPVPDVANLPVVTGECSATAIAPTATDSCSMTLVTGITSDPVEYTDQGTYSITWTYEDDNGNISTQTQTVIVDDVTPPEITCPADLTLGECENVVSFSVTATDNCPGVVNIVSSHASGSTFPIGETTVTSTATDASGNSSSCNFTVNIVASPVAAVGPDVELCEGTTLSLTSSGGTTFEWTGPGGYTSSAQNPVRTNVTPDMSGEYTVTVGNGSGCASSATMSVSVNPLPGIPGAITGISSVLRGGTYSFSTTISDATSYIWNYSGTGATISGNTNPVTITFSCYATNGNLTVKGHNACGDGPVASIPVTTNPGSTINIYTSKLITGSGHHPSTTKSAVMPVALPGSNMGFKVFRSNLIGMEAIRQNFSHIYYGDCNGVQGYCSYNPASDVTASVTVTGPVFTNSGGGPSYKYVMTVPAGKRYLVIAAFEGNQSNCNSNPYGSNPCYIFPGKRTMNKSGHHSHCDDDDYGDNDGDDDNNFQSCSSKDMHLQIIQDNRGKHRPCNTDAIHGSLLLISSPNYIEFSDTLELLPIVYESLDGNWDIVASAAPPEGFYSIPDTTLETGVPTAYMDALQFSIVDTGSVWTVTQLTTKLKHNGSEITHVVAPDMINRQNIREYLSQNFPNPFSSSTTIPYILPVACRVKLSVYNMIGQEIFVFYDKIQQKGRHSETWQAQDNSGRGMPAGVYFAHLRATSVNDGKTVLNTRSMILIK